MVAPTVIALGGNAISPAGRAGTAAEQTENVRRTMTQVAELVAGGLDALVLTHGNGPQVGNVLVKNELARDVVPPVPLDWCVAQTQATIGFTIANTLGFALAEHGIDRPVVPVVSRVCVALDDPAWTHPTKPIGRWVTDADEIARREADGQHFVHDPERGWRRVVPSPQPLECVDRRAIELLLDDGAIVVANGGGGIPVVRDDDGRLRGVEAVVDKDLSAALVAVELHAQRLVILTDVSGVARGYGTAAETWLERIDAAELRALIEAGEFDVGSMGPKVTAACQFAERRAATASIASLDDLVGAVAGTHGTQVLP
ncbi:MAG: carbamate kinase [Nitriliruptoraceae bacterium]